MGRDAKGGFNCFVEKIINEMCVNFQKVFVKVDAICFFYVGTSFSF